MATNTETTGRLALDVPQPVTLAYGIGVDSSAVIVECVRRGIPLDLILTANTKAEKRETMAYVDPMQEFLAAHGYPPITMVSNDTSKHESLEAECLANETMPSLAFGMKTCSLKWKVTPQNRYLNNWGPARLAWAAGLKVVKVIGYDNSPNDCKRGTFGEDGRGKAKCICCRSNPCKKYSYWFPLMEWGMDRDDCIDAIKAAGLPVPMKSSCYFCPAMKPDEIIWLAQNHPDLAQRALKLEENYLQGKHHAGREGRKTTIGLGRKYSWKEILAPYGY